MITKLLDRLIEVFEGLENSSSTKIQCNSVENMIA